MKTKTDRDYVLGTDREELARLSLQHRVWSDPAKECWKRAGIGRGSCVVDVGAGPGYASVDLAKTVGPRGKVISLERSGRFVDAGRALCQKEGLNNVHFEQVDLMTDPFPEISVDAAWCRWVACFVSSPALLISKIAKVVRPGGVAVFHEFIDYSTWRFATCYPNIEQFVQTVMKSWRLSGGEPNVARLLPSLLSESGFKINSASPRIFCIRPGDEMWQWPATFIKSNLKRLLELGLIDEPFAKLVQREFRAAAANPNSLMLTPVLLEIIAEREVL